MDYEILAIWEVCIKEGFHGELYQLAILSCACRSLNSLVWKSIERVTPPYKFNTLKQKQKIRAENEQFITLLLKATQPQLVRYFKFPRAVIFGPLYDQCFEKKSFANITVLDFEANENLNDDRLFTILQATPRVETLNLKGCRKVKGFGLVRACQAEEEGVIPLIKRLNTLTLSGCHLMYSEPRHFSRYVKF